MSERNSTGDGELAVRVAQLGLGPVAEAAGDEPVYLVGGAVRDLLLGREPREIRNLDLAVDGDAIAFAHRVAGKEVREHERFGTATLALAGREIDIARTRAETYVRPGALPDVRPAAIDEDLRRRDFSVNSIAVPLADPGTTIDPFDGRADLGARLLRTLHPASFEDDPTRALRAARYAARFGMELEGETEAQLREADLSTVSPERVEAEMARLLGEPEWRRGFELLAEWGLAGGGDLDLVEAVRATLDRPEWSGEADPTTTALVAGGPAVGTYAPSPGPLREARELASTQRGPSSKLATAAREASPVALVIARALGAEWLDRYLAEWRDVRLEIDGEDLIAAGIEQGPAVGRGLAAALAARLDGQVRGREAELEVALAAARTG